MSAPPIPDNNPVRPITQADLDEHNIQGLVELSYVKTANDVLADSLGSLQTALNLTNDILGTLTGLQTLHNQLVVSGKGTFNFDYAQGGDVDDYVNEYTNAASAFFGTPIDPRFAFSSATASGFADYQQRLLDLRNQLIAQIPALSGVTAIPSGQTLDPNSLLARLRTVLTDLNRFNLNEYSGVAAWALDSYNVHGSGAVAQAGLIQQNLTYAVTAGQSLNNTQTETVRRYLFLFEEYYKSASAILQAITQIIQKMADGITTT